MNWFQRQRKILHIIVGLFRAGERAERRGIIRRPWRHGKERFIRNWLHRMGYEIVLLCFGGRLPVSGPDEWCQEDRKEWEDMKNSIQSRTFENMIKGMGIIIVAYPEVRFRFDGVWFGMSDAKRQKFSESQIAALTENHWVFVGYSLAIDTTKGMVCL